MRNTLFAVLILSITNACHGSTDPTFMKVCQVGDIFLYPASDQVESGACAMPAELVWPALPIKVVVDTELADYNASVDEAFAFWSDGVGHTMFVHAAAGETADVAIVQGSSGDTGLASTAHHVVNGRLTAIIEIRQLVDNHTMIYVVAHELGHVVGLAHDPDSTSIMYPTIETSGLLDDSQLPNLWVTDADADALRALYF